MELKNGDHVKFVDTKRRTRDALVTCIHGVGGELTFEGFKEKHGQYPCINVVAVVTDEDRKDPYGQQTEHASWVVFKNPSSDVAGGYFYFIP
jgi:uncharacterized alpha/beta hydrolase family protein